MDTIELKTRIKVCVYDELDAVQRKLVDLSRKACDKSYSPYSDFAVGAALEFNDGTTLFANNQENAAFPSGICAERCLLFYAKSNFPQSRIVRFAISAKKDGMITETPVSPCGACRQVIQEVSNRQEGKIEILLAGTTYIYIIEDASELLPLQFNAGNMV